MEGEKTLVSIIIPAYNTAQYIDAMLECVINQTYQEIEVIIINDGSKDDTLEKIETFAKQDRRIVVINIPNGGVSNARNIGIQMACGKKNFLYFLLLLTPKFLVNRYLPQSS